MVIKLNKNEKELIELLTDTITGIKSGKVVVNNCSIDQIFNNNCLSKFGLNDGSYESLSISLNITYINELEPENEIES